MWLGISGFEGPDKLNPHKVGPLLSEPNEFEDAGELELKLKLVEDGDEANPQEVQPGPNDGALCVEIEGVAAAPNNATFPKVGAAVLPKLGAEEGAGVAGAPNNDVEVGAAAVLLKEKDVLAVLPKLGVEEGAVLPKLGAEERAGVAGAPNNDVEVGAAAVLLKEKDVLAVPPKLNAEEGAEVV